MIVLTLIFKLAYIVFWAADIALLIYVVLTWLKPSKTPFMQLLARVCEPMLIPARRVLARFIPSKYMRFDFSPLLVWVVLGIGRNLLSLLEGIIL